MSNLQSYSQFDFESGPWTRPVYQKGNGPGVIVIHEMPGLHPEVIRFADRVAEAGGVAGIDVIRDPYDPV